MSLILGGPGRCRCHRKSDFQDLTEKGTMRTPEDPTERTAGRKAQFAIRVVIVAMTIVLAIYVVGNLWHLHQERQNDVAQTPSPARR